MFIYYDNNNNIKFYSESKIECKFDFIKQDLTEKNKEDIGNINNDRKVSNGEIIVTPKNNITT